LAITIKEQLKKYAEYNLWANKRITEVLTSLPDEAWFIEQKSSFNTLRDTVLHLYGAETIWLSRLSGVSPVKMPGLDPSSSNAHAAGSWINASKELLELITQKPESYFTSKCEYNDMRGIGYQMIVQDILQHVFNHSTFHRGQIVTMLRFAGITGLPSTDYITYIRLLGK
jgi:uncharacterized damage-inducible protein DinB